MKHANWESLENFATLPFKWDNELPWLMIIKIVKVLTTYFATQNDNYINLSRSRNKFVKITPKIIFLNKKFTNRDFFRTKNIQIKLKKNIFTKIYLNFQLYFLRINLVCFSEPLHISTVTSKQKKIYSRKKKFFFWKTALCYTKEKTCTLIYIFCVYCYDRKPVSYVCLDRLNNAFVFMISDQVKAGKLTIGWCFHVIQPLGDYRTQIFLFGVFNSHKFYLKKIIDFGWVLLSDK